MDKPEPGRCYCPKPVGAFSGITIDGKKIIAAL